MELDQDRSGNFKEGLIALTFTGDCVDIGIELDGNAARELKDFLSEMMD